MHETIGSAKPSKKRTIVISVLVVALLAALTLAAFFFFQYNDLKNNPEQAADAATKSLVSEVGNLIDLPDDEQPVIATVQDKSKLEDQPFFDRAENGDKLLIYTKAKKAIIYRESSRKVINVGPVAYDEAVQSQGGDAESDAVTNDE